MLEKVLKITIFILIFIILLCGSINLYYIFNKDTSSVISEIEDEQEENILNNEIEQENIEISNDTNEVAENIIQAKSTQTESQKLENNSSSQTVSKQSTVVPGQSNANSQKGQESIQKEKTAVKSSETQDPKVNNNSNNNSSTVTPNVSTSTSTQNEENKKVETFKVNNSMIEKIKNIIVNNPSDTMKQYGYTVVIDESIVNQTNQFTFTETRVKNAIKFKFGTIKIYARDYYVNNQYMWTESFIL